MTRTGRRAVSLVGASLVIPFVAPLALSHGPQGDLDRAVSHLRRQQDQTKVVRIRAEGDRVIVRGAYSDLALGPPEKLPRPPEDEHTELKQDFLLDFHGRRYRRAYQEIQAGKLASWVQVFDGKKTYGSKIDLPIERAADVRPTRMSIISGGDKVNWFTSEWWPYFMSQGFILTAADRHYYWHDIRPPLDRENLFMRGSENAGGRTCEVLRTFPLGSKQNAQDFEYAIDQEDGSVRRMTLRIGEKKEAEIRMSYRRAGERMVPVRWVNEWASTRSQKVWRSETMKVTAVEYASAVDDQTWTLMAEPGTIVQERQYPSGPINILDNKVEKTTTYQADDSGRFVEGEVVGGTFRPRRPYLWWAAGGVVLLALLVGWGLRRRAKPLARRTADGGSSAERGTT